MRDFFPLKTLCMGVIKLLGLEPDKFKYNTKSNVFEENDGAL